MVRFNKVMESVWILSDSVGCCANLVIGRERALLFDTGAGIDDFYEAVREITDLPLIVIASHGHFDHVGGSIYFDCVYMREEDMGILSRYTDDMLTAWLKEMLPSESDDIEFASGGWEQIRVLDFDSIDLGNMECRIVPMKGHTKGSVGILIPDLNLLLSGDALTPVMCLNFDNHMSRSTQRETLMKAKSLDFDRYLTSHNTEAMDKTLVERMIDCIEHSYTGKGYEYQYPRPPYAKGLFYLDSIEGEPVGVIWAKDE